MTMRMRMRMRMTIRKTRRMRGIDSWHTQVKREETMMRRTMTTMKMMTTRRRKTVHTNGQVNDYVSD
jgi:hypothetical protein